MNLETRKITFIQEFLKLQDEEIISGLEKLLHKRQIELLEAELKPMSLEQFNADIDQSLEDAKNDRIVEAKKLKNEIENWR
jgi:hypothetical protein